MTEQNIFEVATRKRFRFNYKGVLTVEDLWTLDVKALDVIFKGLNSQAKQSQEESLLDAKTEEDKELLQKIEIVKFIVAYKLSMAERVKKAQETKAKNQKIMELIDKKKDAALENLSVEELEKMLEES